MIHMRTYNGFETKNVKFLVDNQWNLQRCRLLKQDCKKV